MPFAPQIRKQILKALDDSIIPALQNSTVPQILADSPWDFSAVEHWTVREKYLHHISSKSAQMMWSWKKERLVAGRMPFIGFVYEGVSDDKVGITTRMRKDFGSIDTDASPPYGITALRLPAPAIICFPPGVPHRDGSKPYSDQGHPEFKDSCTLWIRVFLDDLLVHYCESGMDNIFSSHSLQIKDRMLAQMTCAYVEELQYIGQQGNDGTQGLMLCAMQRLRRLITTQVTSIGNTALPFSDHLMSQNGSQPKSEVLCQRTIEYILTHLRDSLTRDTLADQMGVSPFYLNHVFRKTTGMSVIRYVNFLRIDNLHTLYG